MQALILAMIVSVVTFPYLVREAGWLSRWFLYTPEILSMIAAGYVLVVGVQSRFRFVRPVYWLVFGALILLIVVSAIVNQLQPGPMFAGIRNYLRAMPFFFLPAVMLITDRQLRTQLTVLLVLCLIQLPLAYQQRLQTIASAARRGILETEGTTGDLTIGTLMGSGLLTLFLIGAACVLTSFYLRRRLSGGRYLVLLLLVLLPTTLNETKVTLFLLPVALLTVFVIGSEAGTRVRNVAVGLFFTVAFMGVFLAIYDYYMAPRWGYGLIDFLMMEGRVEGYLTRGVQVGDQQRGGMLDGTMAAWAELSRDPLKLIFGFGIGNASDSALGAQFSGEYFRFFQHLPMKSMTYFLLELGLLGLLLVLLLHWLIFVESARLGQRGDSTVAMLALGWCGVSAVIAAGIIYSELIASLAMSYLYWYFSGVIVAAGMRCNLDQLTATPSVDSESEHDAVESNLRRPKLKGRQNA
jgi:hypothetical protein